MEIYKSIRKKMIDKELTWADIVRRSNTYKSSWGIRAAIKNNNKKAIKEVEEILKGN